MSRRKKAWLIFGLLLALLAGSPTKSYAQGTPVYDNVANILHLKDLAQKIKELETEVQTFSVVRQVLAVNRQMADIQNNISDAIGSVQDVMDTAQYYANRIKGTIDYWKNFNVSQMIPFFDPRVFASYRAFLNLKDNATDMVSQIQNTKLQSGEPFSYLTMEDYYNKYTLMQNLQQAQQISDWGAEIGDNREHIEGLSKLNELTKAGARSMGRVAQIVNDIAYQTLSDSMNQAVIRNAKEVGRDKALRAMYDQILNQQ